MHGRVHIALKTIESRLYKISDDLFVDVMILEVGASAQVMDRRSGTFAWVWSAPMPFPMLEEYICARLHHLREQEREFRRIVADCVAPTLSDLAAHIHIQRSEKC